MEVEVKETQSVREFMADWFKQVNPKMKSPLNSEPAGG